MVATADRPWLRRDDWAAGRVEYRHSSWPAVVQSWFMGLGWIAMVAMAGRIILREFDTLSRDGQIGMSIAGIVVFAVGIYLLREAIRETRRTGSGRSVFEMARVPGVLGGRLEGVIRAHSIPMSSDDVQVTLACGVRTFTTTRATANVRSRSAAPEDSYSISAVRWKETQCVDRGRLVESSTGIAIPVSFAIPADLPPTDLLEKKQPIVWRVEARIPSADYNACFYVPVFKTVGTETARAPD
jgi:hypothetical protein